VGVTFEDLRVLQSAEAIADEIWQHVMGWESFAKEVVGGQLARAVDSIGANIAESFGRFHYGEKLNFLYFARGSLFETKYWLNRASKRNLITDEQAQIYANQLTSLARQLNAFTGSLRTYRKTESKHSHLLRETFVEYTEPVVDASLPLFDENDLEWLQTVSKTNSQKRSLNL
jgi:four helix bundle protein